MLGLLRGPSKNRGVRKPRVCQIKDAALAACVEDFEGRCRFRRSSRYLAGAVPALLFDVAQRHHLSPRARASHGSGPGPRLALGRCGTRPVKEQNYLFMSFLEIKETI